MCPEDLANGIAEHYCGNMAYVDPAMIAMEEGIRLVPGNYNRHLDGMLTFQQGHFYLVYNNVNGDDNPRTRFSIAHELGHFYIDSHHAYLRGGGKSHPSHADFRSPKKVESEADQFAACLLLPGHRLRPLAKQQEPSMNALLQAAQSFKTSLTATAFRLVKLTDFCCAVVRTNHGHIDFRWVSEEMSGLGYYLNVSTLPASTPTSQLLRDEGRIQNGGHKEGTVEAWRWFAHRHDDDEVYEEAIGLGRTGAALTLLTLPEATLKLPDDFLLD